MHKRSAYIDEEMEKYSFWQKQVCTQSGQFADCEQIIDKVFCLGYNIDILYLIIERMRSFEDYHQANGLRTGDGAASA